MNALSVNFFLLKITAARDIQMSKIHTLFFKRETRMNIFGWIKPAPSIEEIHNEDEVRKSYKYWRLRIFYGMYIGYVFYYFTRKSLAFAMPVLIEDLGYSKADLGMLASILSITYGVSKFVSGLLSDRANPRFFMAIGLMVTGILNFAFGMSSSLLFFALFWGLNGFFQGWGWPPCARLLTHWYSQKERGLWWGFWNTSHNIGGALIALLAAFCSQYWGWRYSMYVPGVLCFVVGFFIIDRLRDTPQSLGLPPIEKFKNDYHLKIEEDEELSIKQILLRYLLKNKYIWILSFSYFFVYVIRTAINDWSMLFLVEQKNYSLITAGSGIFCFEVGGMLGSLAAGFFSDKVFKGRRNPINVIFCFAVLFAIAMFWFIRQVSPGWNLFFLFLIGFLIFGPQMLIGIAAVELSSKKAAGSATGFVGLFAYIGAAAAGFPLGAVIEHWGWEGFFGILMVCAALAGGLLTPLWPVRYNLDIVQEELKQKKDS